MAVALEISPTILFKLKGSELDFLIRRLSTHGSLQGCKISGSLKAALRDLEIDAAANYEIRCTHKELGAMVSALRKPPATDAYPDSPETVARCTQLRKQVLSLRSDLARQCRVTYPNEPSALEAALEA